MVKYRESGMPEEKLWGTFFDPLECLQKLGLIPSTKLWVDIGCGYGTFLIPGSKVITGDAIGIDVDSSMLEICDKKLKDQKINNTKLIYNDISNKDNVTINSLLGRADYVSLFNILHCEHPHELLQIAYSILGNGGKLGVMHWKKENTPRGPSMELRPKPEAVIEWAFESGFTLESNVDLQPYHFGLLFKKSNG